MAVTKEKLQNALAKVAAAKDKLEELEVYLIKAFNLFDIQNLDPTDTQLADVLQDYNTKKGSLVSAVATIPNGVN